MEERVTDRRERKERKARERERERKGEKESELAGKNLYARKRV